MSQIEQAAQQLIDVRATGNRIPALPDDLRPADLDTAYKVQTAHIAALTGQGQTQIGWKIGCTNETAQAELGLDAPFYGCIMRPAVHQSPHTVPAAEFGMTVIEAEYAFQMAEDLPPAAAPYDPAAVAASVGAICPAIEIVDSRYSDWKSVGALHLIADNGCHGAWVHGAPVSDWQSIDFITGDVTLTVNGEKNRDGQGANIMGDPLNALTWLANATVFEGGHHLRAGDWISTGTTIVTYHASAGDHIVADFAGLGQVDLTLT